MSAATCKCVGGKGEACSHVAALMFYIEDYIRNAENHGRTLLEDRTHTDQLQQWHVPSKRDISSKCLSDKVLESLLWESGLDTYHQPTQHSTKCTIAHLSFAGRLSSAATSHICTMQFCIKWNFHFWLATPTSKEPQQNSDMDIDAGLTLLENKQIVMASTQTGLDETIDITSEYSKKLCHDYEQEQIIDQQPADFIEANEIGITLCKMRHCLTRPIALST